MDNNIKAARLSFINMLYDGNISVTSGEYVKQFAEQYGCPKLGDRRRTTNLMSTLHSRHILKLKETLTEHCADYAITFDCSSYSFSAEALIIRSLDEALWVINEFLGILNLYEEHLDSENTAGLLKTFIRRFNLHGKGLVCAMMDGAAVNTAAITKLNKKFDDAHVMRARCLSHFLTLVGKRMTESYPN